MKIRPSATGKITYNVFVNTKTTKSVNVVDGAGKNITSFQGSGEQKIAGQVEFDVIKDGTYYIYMSGSGSLRLGGFTFTPSAGDDTDDPVATSVSTFNISDFNVQGKAFGPEDLQSCVHRGVIHILDDATIETMKVRYAEKKQHEEALRQAEAVADGEAVDWQEVQRQWDEYYAQRPEWLSQIYNASNGYVA